MKKKIVALLISIGIVCNLTGCGETIAITNEDGVVTEYNLYGRFVELDRVEYYDTLGNHHYQSICYDKDTKIMYVIDNRSYGVSISPFYVMNTENEPVIGVYTEAMED